MPVAQDQRAAGNRRRQPIEQIPVVARQHPPDQHAADVHQPPRRPCPAADSANPTPASPARPTSRDPGQPQQARQQQREVEAEIARQHQQHQRSDPTVAAAAPITPMRGSRNRLSTSLSASPPTRTATIVALAVLHVQRLREHVDDHRHHRVPDQHAQDRRRRAVSSRRTAAR